MNTKNKYILMVLTFIITLSITLFAINLNSYATQEEEEENQLNETNSSNSQTNTENNSNTSQTNPEDNQNKVEQETPTTPSQEQNQQSTTKVNSTRRESSNANLSDFGIIPHDFTGFKYGTTTYDVTVPEDTESIEVYAKTQDSKATVSGTGIKTLEMGKNTFSVVVTAEDGTTKTYTLNIIRGNEENSTAEQEQTEEQPEEQTNQEEGNRFIRIKNK